MKTNEATARDIIQSRLTKGLLGPGSDNWGIRDDEEIISGFPLQRYFTGVLFPLKDLHNIKTQDQVDEKELEAETTGIGEIGDSEDTGNEEEIDPGEPVGEDDKGDETFVHQIGKDKDDEIKIAHNNFFPNNIGLTLCIEQSVKEIEVEFSVGIYYQPKQDEIKIKAPEEIYRELTAESSRFPFKNILKYEKSFLSLTRELEGNMKERTGDYEIFDSFMKSEGKWKDESISYFKNLIGRAWKRIPFRIKKTIDLESVPRDFQTINPSGEHIHEELKIEYHVKVFAIEKSTGKKYVKIVMANRSTKHPLNKFYNNNEDLNRKCLFQSKIRVFSNRICAYKPYRDRNPFDEEAAILNLQYKDVQDYAIGHNCAVTWNENHSTVETTFFPEYELKDSTNDIKEELSDQADHLVLDKILEIKNLSIFGLAKDEVIENLCRFIDLYEHWIGKQRETKDNLDSNEEKKTGEKIIEKLEYNHKRLKENIQLLHDDIIFKAFQYANTAMLLQFIISNDDDFAGKEKHLTELKQIDYQDLDFFKQYEKSFEYRPFQLAFFILSLDGLVDPASVNRRETVDLIWFPTGGGKTEAYLATAAFAIIWRRMNNETGYEGTTVIMRYTLRLLTAQQFERASRLIASLEFLRRQFTGDLKEDPIFIGLWIGQGACPNTIEDARKKINEIEEECNKENGRPEEKNVFQISACPWCGTKIISRRRIDKDGNEEWDRGINAGKKKISFECLNQKCPFHDDMPVQVVDDMLYKKAPTLLFATVDKFAVLARQEDGHMFFNSLAEDKKPPDLIIQDELHLISGPLGSITGLFESIVELLSERNGASPKIIASTATTRNTDAQVKQLYGGRQVNTFPPPGLYYNDSFFARESKTKKKRKYIGIMPTGKTGIDTQLQVLAHLLTARLEVYLDRLPDKDTDNYWTIVSYYNSLKEVGRMYNKVGEEVKVFTSQLQTRLFGEKQELNFNYNGITRRTKELTSREESHKIKSVLSEIEKPFEREKIKETGKGSYLEDIIDLILATNMISVGIDISRLNLMLINGMPKNAAEYIQASSRVGRQEPGLVITLFDSNRARDKSYFEHFVPFHQAFYKNIEPLSITPFTENTIDKMLATMMITYIRHKIPGMGQDKSAGKFKKGMLIDLKDFLKKRFPGNSREYDFFLDRLDALADDWIKHIDDTGLTYKQLIKKPSDKTELNQNWVVMQSMRDVDSDTYIQIKNDFQKKVR